MYLVEIFLLPYFVFSYLLNLFQFQYQPHLFRNSTQSVVETPPFQRTRMARKIYLCFPKQALSKYLRVYLLTSFSTQTHTKLLPINIYVEAQREAGLFENVQTCEKLKMYRATQVMLRINKNACKHVILFCNLIFTHLHLTHDIDTI